MKNSTLSTYLNTVKVSSIEIFTTEIVSLNSLFFVQSVIGIGILSFPFAMKEAGLIAGIISFSIIAPIVVYGMILIVQMKIRLPKSYRITSEGNKIERQMRYDDIIDTAFGRLGRYVRKKF